MSTVRRKLDATAVCVFAFGIVFIIASQFSRFNKMRPIFGTIFMFFAFPKLTFLSNHGITISKPGRRRIFS